MKRITRLSFLLFMISSSVFGQIDTLILTKDQNNRWLDTVKILPLDKQLSAIIQRLLSDKNVFVNQRYPDRIKAAEQIGNKLKGDGKPFLIIGGYPMTIDNNSEIRKIIAMTQLLTVNYIKTIYILSPNDPATTALYGHALNGIIVMTLRKKKYAKLFRQLKLN